MRTIDEAVSRVSAIIVEVANASGEQAEGIHQVNQAVAHLDSATQQNAALVEQAAATAQRLAEQADVLDEAVRLFTIAGTHSSSRDTPAQRKMQRTGSHAGSPQAHVQMHTSAHEREEAFEA